jgi:peptidoglycan/xylan/chitin deacetylase (PgdA/CDA1 family)
VDEEARRLTGPLVLCYHAVSETFPAALSITPARFEAHLALLARRGYRGATFSEAAAAPAGERVVAITFDDAYRSVGTLGLPLLAARGWPATMFAPSDHVGSDRAMRWPGIDQWHGGPHEDELLPMGWEELRALEREGWEVGSHTCSHPHLTQLGDEDLVRELRDSRAACAEGLGHDVDTIAYPYGDVDDRVVAATRAAGYRLAAALPSRMHAVSDLRWPRIGIYHGDDERRFALKVSPLVGRLRASALWGTISAARGRA